MLNLPALLSLAAGTGALLLAGYVLMRSQPSPASRIFFLLLCLVALCSLAEFGYRHAISYEVARQWLKVGSLWALACAALLHFALEFTERFPARRRRTTLGLIYLPAAAIVATGIATSAIHGLPARAAWGGWKPDPPFGSPLYVMASIWAAAIGLLTLAILFRDWVAHRRTARGKRDKHVLLGTAFPLLVAAATRLILPLADIKVIDLTTSAAAVGGLFITYAVWRHSLFRITPLTAASNIVRSMSDGVLLVDPEGRILLSNPAARRMLDIDERGLLFEPVGRFLKMQAVAAAADGRGSGAFDTLRDGEAFLQAANGSRIPVSVACAPVAGESGSTEGMLILARDITERKRSEAALRRTWEQYRDLLDNVMDAVLVVNRRGIVIFANRAAHSFLEVEEGLLVNTQVSFPVQPGDSAEMTVPLREGVTRVADMRITEIDWFGSPLMLAVFRDVTDKVQARERMRTASITDELTGLVNRRGLLDSVRHFRSLSERQGFPLAFILADMDGLKTINDRYGHDAGDLALRDTAHILHQTFRGSDLIGRLGGDEFIVLVLLNSAAGIEPLIHRLELNLTAFNSRRQRPFSLSLSVGHSVCLPDEPLDVEACIERADRMMYRQKAEHKAAAGPA